MFVVWQSPEKTHIYKYNILASFFSFFIMSSKEMIEEEEEEGGGGEEYEDKRENYVISFSPAYGCHYLDCSLCYSELLNLSHIVVIGKSLHDPDVREANMRYLEGKRKRVKELRLIRSAMQAMMITTNTLSVLDSLSNDYYYYYYYHDYW